MNPLGTAILSVVLLITVSAPRRWALIGIMGGVLFLTQSQQMQILGFNLYAIRFVELAGFIRVLSRKEFSFSQMGGIDRALLLLYTYTTIIFLLRSHTDQAYQIGLAVDAFLCYFAFRGLVQGADDFRWFLQSFLLLMIPFSFLVIIEGLTSHNLFSSLGGLQYDTYVRNGRIRAFGSFRHPTLMGTLGGSFLPLYIAFIFFPKGRNVALLGIAACVATVWASNSGGPLNCVMVGLFCWFLWKQRTKTRFIRWALLLLVVSLGLVMKAPIWYLPAKVSSMSGGDGWHRSHLMDMAFQDINKWGAIGMSLKETSDWFSYTLSTGTADMTNEFLAFGMSAGLGALFLFVYLLVRAFSEIGKALIAVRINYAMPSWREYLLWGLGTTLVVHMFNWLGITYFDQTYVIWFMQLAAITSLSTESQRKLTHAENAPNESGGFEVIAGNTGVQTNQLDHFSNGLVPCWTATEKHLA